MNDNLTPSQQQPVNPGGGISPHPTGRNDNRITNAPSPPPAAKSGKLLQWVIAGGVLAVLVVVVTYAMNFLGGGTSGTNQTGTKEGATLNWLFGRQAGRGQDPTDTNPLIEAETNIDHYRDFWFVNENDKSILLGGAGLGCARCSSMELHLFPNPGTELLDNVAQAIAGGKPEQARELLDKYAKGHEPERSMLISQVEKSQTMVPAKSAGWVRMTWNADKAGPKTISAGLWLHHRINGPGLSFDIHGIHYDAIRVRPDLRFGTISEEAIEKGVRQEIQVWSSTRESLNLVVTPPARPSDTLVAGTPVAMTKEELASLRRENASSEASKGPVLCGYKVPVTLLTRAADGKTRIDIGPFSRTLMLNDQAIEDKAKGVSATAIVARPVTVTGRVRGWVEFAGREEGSLDFRAFPGSEGTREVLEMTSDNRQMKVKVDEDRTPKWLRATLGDPTNFGESGVQWKVRVEVRKGQVSGNFPRPGDPLYEDSAVYLTATRAEGKDAQTKSIRIPVRGTATVR